MTSEVVVMNRLSVALAADSASTVMGPDGKEKIWNSANKLFALSRCQPVGVMFYSDPSIAGVPWETLIKEFRASEAAKSYSTLEEYACAFVGYLRDNPAFFSLDAQREIFFKIVKRRFAEIYEAGNASYFRKIVSNQKTNAAAEMEGVIDPVFAGWKGKKDLQVVGEDVARAINEQYRSDLESIINNQFGSVGISDNAKAKLLRIAEYYGSKEDFELDYTGMVFAGFGSKDLYPVVRHLKIGPVIGGYFRYTKDKDHKISESEPSMILPFAQRDMVETFLAGVSPRIMNTLLRSCLATTSGLTTLILEKITDLAADRKAYWKGEIEPEVKRLMASLGEEFRRSRESNQSPILGSLVHLPKDEIADVAESLVNLNYFQKKVSMESETVGGPIDVAVISKGDGFIWIKRKHYFSAEQNPQYFMSLKRQFNGGVM